MPINLYALCRPNAQLEIKRVSLTQPVQAKIEGIFQGQATAFLDGISEEVEFGGDWKPDSDELLVIEAPAEIDIVQTAVAANPVSLNSINSANFENEGIKGLFINLQSGGQSRILIQSFSAQQILARRFSLMLDGNTFKELTDPAFTLDNYLTAIVEDNKLKFKSFFNVKRIFELNQFYQEASDQQIDGFCGHQSLQVANVAAFKVVADQQIRKMIHAIVKAGVLDNCKVSDIVAQAASLGLNIAEANGKLMLPTERKDIKTLLRFLDDGIYQAPLSATKYVTNSKRPFGR
jgi:Domain of unknown function (DUF4868)